jgi:hypothetical protein
MHCSAQGDWATCMHLDPARWCGDEAPAAGLLAELPDAGRSTQREDSAEVPLAERLRLYPRASRRVSWKVW